MNKTLTWGILSTGNIANNFARTAAKMNELADSNSKVIIGAVASRSKEKSQEFADHYQIPKAYGSYKEMVEDPDIDVIYIATPHSHHLQHIKLCLEHGKHVLCEKSFTVNAQEAKAAYALAEEKNLFLMEGFWTKFIPVYQDLEQILKEGTIGDITMLTAQYGFCTGYERGIRKFDPALAGGTLLDIGVYAIGFAAMILGYEPKEIQSLVQLNDVGTDTYSSILMQYENGAIAQLSTAIQTNMPLMGAVYGSKGYIEIPNFKNPTRIRVVPNEGEAWEISRPLEVNGFEYEIREVQKCIAEGRTASSRMTPEQSIAVMSIMDRVREIWGMKFPME